MFLNVRMIFHVLQFILHVVFVLSVMFSGTEDTTLSRYRLVFRETLLNLDITTKETKALNNTLVSFGDELRHARVDAYVDS